MSFKNMGSQKSTKGSAQGVILVDPISGLPIDTLHPLSVELSDGSVNIGTVNAELEVQLSHKDNDPDTGDVHDSVRIGDGVEELVINADGSINAAVTSMPSTLPTSAGNMIVPIPTSGPTDRTQLPTHACKYLSIQFKAGTGKVYIGGSTVTNSSGANEGVDLDPDDVFGPIEISNTNAIYVATSVVGNNVKVFWTV